MYMVYILSANIVSRLLGYVYKTIRLHNIVHIQTGRGTEVSLTQLCGFQYLRIYLIRVSYRIIQWGWKKFVGLGHSVMHEYKSISFNSRSSLATVPIQCEWQTPCINLDHTHIS